MTFLYHNAIQKEIADLKGRFHSIREAFSIFERLCEVQFHPTEPKKIIAPAKLHRITHNAIWTMWKVELVIPKSGLRPNQYPRVWFAVKGNMIVFLCLSSHVDNYKDEEMNNLALTRVSDFF